MKNLKFLSVLVFSILFLASCEKPENEENKPEEPTPEVTTEPRIDLIRKVIRYNTTGGIEDSVLFKYDSQNRVTKIEYGPYVNGQFRNKVIYQDSIDQYGKRLVERSYELDNSGNYKQLFFMVYSNNTSNKIGSAYRYLNSSTYPNSRYSLTYDSLGLIKDVRQLIYKQGDWFFDISFKYANSNLVEAVSGGDPFGYYITEFEYFSQPYNFNIYTGIYEEGQKFAWNANLIDQFDFRNCILGRK